MVCHPERSEVSLPANSNAPGFGFGQFASFGSTHSLHLSSTPALQSAGSAGVKAKPGQLKPCDATPEQLRRFAALCLADHSSTAPGTSALNPRAAVGVHHTLTQRCARMAGLKPANRAYVHRRLFGNLLIKSAPAPCFRLRSVLHAAGRVPAWSEAPSRRHRDKAPPFGGIRAQCSAPLADFHRGGCGAGAHSGAPAADAARVPTSGSLVRQVIAAAGVLARQASRAVLRRPAFRSGRALVISTVYNQSRSARALRDCPEGERLPAASTEGSMF